MTIRTILIPLAGSGDMRPVLELGLTFGKELNFHVDVLNIQSDPRDTVPLLGEGMSVTMIEDMIKIAETEGNKQASVNKTLFDQIVSKLSLSVNDEPNLTEASAMWSQVVGRNDEITARHGRLSDLIVVNHPNVSSDVLETLTLNAALFDTGRPVLVAQPIEENLAINPMSKNFHMGIYWNGSIQSVRALSAALGLITKPKNITIMTAESDQTSIAQVSELVKYLKRHGIESNTNIFKSVGSQSVGAALITECLHIKVNLLVMGAYAQSRVRQLILGGVTRYVLENAKISLFMAH